MAKISFAEKIKNLFGAGKSATDDFYDDLTDALIEGDVGAKAAFLLSDELKKKCGKNTSRDEVTGTLKELLMAEVKETSLEVVPGKVNIWMVLGVNGVGKTTTVAKLANLYSKKIDAPVVLASSDTFRAAAIEQLEMHGEKIGVRVVSHQHGSDPSAVVYDAADAVRAKGGGLVIADTAGRLHTKENLVRELEKIDRTCKTKADEGCYRRVLVIDSTTGQNAFRQAEVFGEAVPIDALIMTKYDSTAKGGVAVSICKELGIPVAYICDGEKYENIAPFSAEQYVRRFLGEE